MSTAPAHLAVAPATILVAQSQKDCLEEPMSRQNSLGNRHRGGSKGKHLTRSHAMRESTSPPRTPTPRSNDFLTPSSPIVSPPQIFSFDDGWNQNQLDLDFPKLTPPKSKSPRNNSYHNSNNNSSNVNLNTANREQDKCNSHTNNNNNNNNNNGNELQANLNKTVNSGVDNSKQQNSNIQTQSIVTINSTAIVSNSNENNLYNNKNCNNTELSECCNNTQNIQQTTSIGGNNQQTNNIGISTNVSPQKQICTSNKENFNNCEGSLSPNSNNNCSSNSTQNQDERYCCESPSDGLQREITNPGNNTNNKKNRTTSTTKSNKPRLKTMGSSSSVEGGNNSSGFISRDSSSEQFTDQSGVDLIQFFKETLNKNAKDRNMLMRIEKELLLLALDRTKDHIKFPAMSSYNRMLIHRVAAYFGMEHNVDSTQQCVIAGVTKSTRVPEVRFKSLIRDTFTEEPRKSILKRDAHSFDECRQFLGPDRGVLDRKAKSFEEREEEYEKGENQDSWAWTNADNSECVSRVKAQNNRLLKVQSVEARQSDRPSVSKSHSFGGYGGQLTGLLLRGDSVTSTKSAGGRLFTKQDSIGSTNTPWRLSPSSSGYKTQSIRSDSITPSPTGYGSGEHTPEPAVQSPGTACGVVWAVTDMASVPRGSVLIDPNTLQPIVNQDGSIYHFDPSNLPPKSLSTKPPMQQRSFSNTKHKIDKSKTNKNSNYNECDGVTTKIDISENVIEENTESIEMKTQKLMIDSEPSESKIYDDSNINNDDDHDYKEQKNQNFTNQDYVCDENDIETIENDLSDNNKDNIITQATIINQTDDYSETNENHTNVNQEIDNENSGLINENFNNSDHITNNSNNNIENNICNNANSNNNIDNDNNNDSNNENINNDNDNNSNNVNNNDSNNNSNNNNIKDVENEKLNNGNSDKNKSKNFNQSVESYTGNSSGYSTINNTNERNTDGKKDDYKSSVSQPTIVMSYAGYSPIENSNLFSGASGATFPAYQQGSDGSIYALPQPMMYAYPPTMEPEVSGYFLPIYDQGTANQQRDATTTLLTTPQATAPLYQPQTAGATAVVPLATYPSPLYQGQVVYAQDQFTDRTGQISQCPITYPMGYPYTYNSTTYQGYWGPPMTYYVPQPQIASAATNLNSTPMLVTSTSTNVQNANSALNSNSAGKRGSPPQTSQTQFPTHTGVNIPITDPASGTTTMYAIPPIYPSMLPYSASTPSVLSHQIQHPQNAVINSIIPPPPQPPSSQTQQIEHNPIHPIHSNNSGTPQSTPSTPLSLPLPLPHPKNPPLFATPPVLPNGLTSQIGNVALQNNVENNPERKSSCSSMSNKRSSFMNTSANRQNNSMNSFVPQSHISLSHNPSFLIPKKTHENHVPNNRNNTAPPKRADTYKQPHPSTANMTTNQILQNNHTNMSYEKNRGPRPKPSNLDLRRSTSNRNTPSTNSTESNNSPNSVTSNNEHSSVYVTRGSNANCSLNTGSNLGTTTHLQQIHQQTTGHIDQCHQQILNAYNSAGMYVKLGQTYFTHPSMTLSSNRRTPPNDVRPQLAPIAGVYPAMNVMFSAPRHIAPRPYNPNYKGNKPR